jgi:transcription-repair coupling factor (superfamily II helicase)
MNPPELTKIFSTLPFYQVLLKNWERESNLKVTGVTEVPRAFLIASLTKERPNPSLIVAPSLDEAESLKENLDTLLEEKKIVLFPDFESAPQGAIQANVTVMAQRAKVIEALLKKEEPSVVVITTSAALTQKMVPKESLEKKIQTFTKGEAINFDKLLEKIINLGYQRVPMVEKQGEISVRGGIIDIYPLNTSLPVRLEFLGDTLESLRVFEPSSQRSVSSENYLRVFPLEDVFNPSGTASLLDYFSPSLQVFIIETPDANLILNESKFRELKILWLSLLRKDLTTLHFPSENVEDFSTRPRDFIKELRELVKARYQIWIVLKEEHYLRRVQRMLSDYTALELLKELHFKIGFLSSGFIIREEKVALFTDKEIFGRIDLPLPQKKVRKPFYLPELKAGDFVVHTHYGIGKFLGIQTCRVEERDQDFFVIEYAEGEKLLLPFGRLNLLQKYTSSGSFTPRVDKLGSRNWRRTKQRVKEATQELAQKLLELYAVRTAEKGYAFPPDTEWQADFEAAFPYIETPEQLQALQEIKRDLESPQPMDRLICGDTGFGKTELAFRAAFKVVMSYKQVAFLAPTTILVEQHYRNLCERLQHYPVKVKALSRFRTKAEQQEIIHELKEGKVDIVIGTHRLLQKDVRFKDLGLIIIDDEQHFGVQAKEKLKEFRKTVDTLSLSATPIPRTLYMALIGLRKISLVTTPPPGRRPVITYVLEFNESVLKEALTKEIARGGQVFVVYPRVEDIEKVGNYLKNCFPTLNIGIAHGKLPGIKLDTIIRDFLDKKYDVLLATTLIEAGVDFPNVNTLIVWRSDLFGLAQLYQLRGRVGRALRQAYAYFFYPKGKLLSSSTYQRLKALEDFSELGGSFDLARRDLELRGAGNLLGREQSGHINAVGFELYSRLLEEAVKKLKGEEVEEEKPIQISLPYEARLPEEYIPESRTRCQIYKRLAEVVQVSSLKELEEELVDRFGALPLSVKNLLKIVKLRLFAKKFRIEYLGFKKPNLKIEFSKLPRNLGELLKKLPAGYPFSFKESGKISLEVKIKEEEEILTFLEKFLTPVSQVGEREKQL